MTEEKEETYFVFTEETVITREVVDQLYFSEPEFKKFFLSLFLGSKLSDLTFNRENYCDLLEINRSVNKSPECFWIPSSFGLLGSTCTKLPNGFKYNFRKPPHSVLGTMILPNDSSVTETYYNGKIVTRTFKESTKSFFYDNGLEVMSVKVDFKNGKQYEGLTTYNYLGLRESYDETQGNSLKAKTHYVYTWKGNDIDHRNKDGEFYNIRMTKRINGVLKELVREYDNNGNLVLEERAGLASGSRTRKFNKDNRLVEVVLTNVADFKSSIDYPDLKIKIKYTKGLIDYLKIDGVKIITRKSL